MNTRVLMDGSALLMAILGIAATFFPQEILAYASFALGFGIVLFMHPTQNGAG